MHDTSRHVITRRKRFRAVRNPAPIMLTDRDIDILRLLLRFRFLDTPLIFKGLGHGSYRGLQSRLRALFDHGFIDRPVAQISQIILGNRPMIYALSDAGLARLKSLGLTMDTKARLRDANRSSKFSYISHELNTAACLIALKSATHNLDEVAFLNQEELITASDGTLTSLKWPTQICYRHEPSQSFNLAPDSGFGLQTAADKNPKWFFLELDRGTEPIARSTSKASSILRKMLSYADTHHESQTGLSNFRVMFVTTGAERITSMQTIYSEHVSRLAPPGLFLFTTQNAMLDDPFGKIWKDGKNRPIALLD